MATSSAGGESRYVGLQSRAAWAWRLLLLAVVLDALAVLSGVAHYNMLTRIAAGEPVAAGEAQASGDRQALVGLAQSVVFLLTAVFFVRWFHRAYANLPALGSGELRYRTWWAIGGWFIPIMNLFRPKQILNDVWRASDPELPPDTGRRWIDGPVPVLFAVWWIGYLVTGAVYNGAFRVSLRAEAVEELQRATALTAVADALSIVTGVLAIVVVRRVTARQEARAEFLARGSPGEPFAVGPPGWAR